MNFQGAKARSSAAFDLIRVVLKTIGSDAKARCLERRLFEKMSNDQRRVGKDASGDQRGADHRLDWLVNKGKVTGVTLPLGA